MSELTPAAALAWQIAAVETGGAGHERIERGHLVIGVLSLEKLRDTVPPTLDVEPSALASIRQEIRRLDDVLQASRAGAVELRRRLRVALGTGAAPGGRSSISRSEPCKLAFLRAVDLARGAHVSALHIFAALTLEPDALLVRVLTECGVDGARLSHAALQAVTAPSRPEEERSDPGGSPAPRPPAAAPEAASATPTLDRYGRDLTRLAARGELGPFVGRRELLLELIQTLARSGKNNPLLLGEAGVGKTAIVEALAVRGALGKDPVVLGGKRIVEISVGALLAGTQYRGELEERITSLLEETKAHPEVIVFIDELHTIVGAGRIGQSGLDAANLLKPALARGDLRCIGATTLAEYRRYIETDEALDRRFARIDVPEPTREEALEILRGRRARWEAHHGVSIDDEALAAAVDLSLRFDSERHLPDKAIDLVDQASARARVPTLSLMAPPEADAAAVARAAATVSARVVAEVVAERSGLPLELVVAGSGGARLLELPDFLSGKLIGQEEAVRRVSERLRLAHAGLQHGDRPQGVFLFLGPTGVGKTELARLLALFLFGSRERMLRLDMSELMEEHSIAKLIGAPPGYVGHDEEGRLTSALRSHPYSIVLLDEAEKAHPRIFDLFLQLFDEGRVTDAKGRAADGRHAIFIMTSNLGTSSAADVVVGFAPGAAAAADPSGSALEAAKRYFRPELLNRIDEVVVFNPLGPEAVRRIARGLLETLRSDVRRRHAVDLLVAPEAEELLAAAGFSATQGAREMARTVERLVEVPLSALVLSGELARHPAWRVVVDAGTIRLLPGPA